MEELQPQEIEELLQELEEETQALEPDPQDIEELLQVLRSGGVADRLDAAERLGKVNASSHQIVRALILAFESDSYKFVNMAAAKALRAPVHQEYLNTEAELREATERALQRRPGADRQRPGAGGRRPTPKRSSWETTERVVTALPDTRPDHFRVESEGDTLHIAWRLGLRQRVEGSWVPLVLLVLSILWALQGELSLNVLQPAALALVSAYWIAVVWANSTRIEADKEEWVFQRGPLPHLSRRLYLSTRRLDPATCKRVWLARREEYKRRWSRTGGSGKGTLGCLFGLVELFVFLVGTDRELVVSHKLYARGRDGDDEELLRTLSAGEAGYLGKTLQDLLEDGRSPR